MLARPHPLRIYKAHRMRRSGGGQGLTESKAGLGMEAEDFKGGDSSPPNDDSPGDDVALVWRLASGATSAAAAMGSPAPRREG